MPTAAGDVVAGGAASHSLGAHTRFVLTALVVWAALFAAHPMQSVSWFDVGRLVEGVAPFPLSPGGAVRAVEFQARQHSPNYFRPVRALQWLVIAKIAGSSPRRLYVANVVSLGLAIACLMEVARRLGAHAWVVGLCFAASYVSVYPMLYIGFGFTLAFGFLGLLAYFAGRPWSCFALLLVAGLSHEIMLALTLVPMAHAVIEQNARRPAWPAAAVIPVYLVCRVIHLAVFGHGPVLTSLLESPLRVTVTVASGGLPLEPVRALPWLAPYLRVRELFSSAVGLGTLAAVCAPAVVLSILAWRGVSRRRALFLTAWALLGSVPLLLPMTTPEAFHVSVALAGVFMLWASRPLSTMFLVVLAVWLLLHGWARERLFYQDLPVVAAAAQALIAVRDDPQAEVVDVPIQAGPHYAMLPDVGFRGCLVDPLWVWSSPATGDLQMEKAAGRRVAESGTSFVRLCPVTR